MGIAFTGCGVPQQGDAAGSDPRASAELIREVEAWREERHARLIRPYGYLSLIALSWLENGENAFGSDPNLPIVLPAEDAPALAGSFFLEGERVRVEIAQDAQVTLDGEPVRSAVLRADDPGPADILLLGNLHIFVVKRGERYGIRVQDPDASTLVSFRGVENFPISDEYVVDARFVPYEEARTVQVPTVLGTTVEMKAFGRVDFDLAGETLSLEPFADSLDDETYWLIFKDRSSGVDTYAAGRFLIAPRPNDGIMRINFNKSYNPPCAFTAFATCPLPPQQNVLNVRIAAGEKKYHE